MGSLGMMLVVQVQVTGTLEGTVDWNSASNNVAIAWLQGDCRRENCTVSLSSDISSSKPKTVTTSQVPPGLYTLVIQNLGTTTESISYSIAIIG